MENSTVIPESPTAPASLSQRSSFKIFILSLSFVLFGVLLGVLIDRFLLSVSLQSDSELNPAPTASISATPTAVITPAILATQNWRTYTDPQKLYTIKYPTDSKLNSYVKPSIDITFLGPTQKPQTEFYDGYKVTISYETLSSQTPTAIVNKIYQHATDSCPVPEKAILSPLTPITISGEPAWQYSVQDCFGDATLSYVARSGKLFSLSSVYMGPTSDVLQKYQDESSQIISTFQFVSSSQTSYTCPATEWVDCMPSTDSRPRPQCSREFLDWARASCPGFQGAAL